MKYQPVRKIRLEDLVNHSEIGGSRAATIGKALNTESHLTYANIVHLPRDI